MNIKKYRNSGIFFGLSRFIPSTRWSLTGYINHKTSSNTKVKQWVIGIAFLGLMLPVIVTLFMARGNRVMQDNLISLFLNFRNIKPTYIVACLVIGILLIGTTAELKAQTITQTISGKVFDDITKESLPFATIVVKDSDPIIRSRFRYRW